MKITALFIVIIALYNLVSTSFQTDIDNSLFNYNFIDNFKTENDMKDFQRSILLQRNYECLNRKHFSLDELKTHEKNSESTMTDLYKTVRFN